MGYSVRTASSGMDRQGVSGDCWALAHDFLKTLMELAELQLRMRWPAVSAPRGSTCRLFSGTGSERVRPGPHLSLLT